MADASFRMKVPFLNLENQYVSIKQTMDEAISGTIRRFLFVGGSDIASFESAMAIALNTPHVISTANGTDALFIALKAIGIKPGDEVITPAFGCIPSSETISLCNAKPVFVDIDPNTYTIDARRIEEKITGNTRAVIAVHLFGQAAPMSDIKGICRKHHLHLIEDCAQAHLTKENDQVVGSFGIAGAFSFYPTKNLGAYGDAGCLTTYDDSLAIKMRRLANHGALEKDDHLIEGMNSRMDTLQASVLLAKLPHLNGWNEKRRANAALYDSLLGPISEVRTPQVRSNTVHTFHIYAIRTKNRDALKGFLRDKGIQTIVHYPSALPNLQAYKYLNHKPSDFPVSSRIQDEILSLPVYPELTEQQIRYVCSAIKAFYAEN